MCLQRNPTTIQYASLLAYVPYKRWCNVDHSPERLDALKMGKAYMVALKNNNFQPDGPVPIHDSIALWCAERDPFPGFFSPETILVPVPGSTLTKPHTPWVPRSLAEAMEKQKLGTCVPCLRRAIPIQKSSHSVTRPDPDKHYQTMSAKCMLEEPKSIMLVDDVVARGATFLGATRRVTELHPNADIRAFAAMGTVSVEGEFCDVMDPRHGTIRWAGDGHAQRIPSPRHVG